MIEVKATIEKASITPMHGLIGYTNDEPVIVAGVNYAARALSFQGFRGRINLDTRKYDGGFLFQPVGQGKDKVLDKCCDFAAHGFGVRAEEPTMACVLNMETSDGTDSDADGDLDTGDDVGKPVE